MLTKQIEAFNPDLVCVEEERDAIKLKKRFRRLEVLWGESGLKEVASKAECDILLNSLVGMRGLVPTYEAIKSGKNIALANKETLVTGGKFIIDEAKKNGVKILPVDSEHSAIFQALQGNSEKDIKRIYLTASGGPFRGYTLKELEGVTLEQALRHPNWSMGSKITIDSATMMNKGLEVIEARWLFDIEPEYIDVIVHKESIIHSMVEYKDHSIIAQLGAPDMRVPISYALTYPERIRNDVPTVDFFSLGSLAFEKADTKVFRCLDLAYEAIKKGKSYPVVLNAANEVLVQQFIEGKISFIDIQRTIERVMEEHVAVNIIGLSDILSIDQEIRGKLE